MAQRTVFLTGATGFIGNRVARQLAARGDNLRCLVRDTSRGLFLESLGAELIPGEVTDTIALQRGLRGADIAYHIAGYYDIGPIDVRHMERVNVGGTRCFLEECARARIPRAVHISTTAALGPIPEGIGDEHSSWSGPYPSTYHRTKTEAHEAAKQAQQRGLPLLIVCPANVYGPGDKGPNGRFIRDLIRGRVPALLRDPAWLSHVYVDDVVEGMIAAGDRGMTGATYVLSGEAASINDFAERVARIAGRRPPPLRLPVTAVSIAAGLADVVSRVTRMRFTTNREAVRVAYHHRWLHSHERATREFGWTPRSLDEGLASTVRWFVENPSVDGDGRARGAST